MVFNRSVQLKVKNGVIKKPIDLGMVYNITYNGDMYATIIDSNATFYKLKFYNNDSPEFVTMNYFDINFSKPIAKPEEIDKDILDIKMWFGTWYHFRERMTELEDDEKEAAYERLELDKLK